MATLAGAACVGRHELPCRHTAGIFGASIRMVVLTEELVLQKTRSEDLATVRNLNLWGSDLSDVSILAVSTTPGGLCPWRCFGQAACACET